MVSASVKCTLLVHCLILDAVTKLGFEELEYTVVEGENTTVCVTFDRKLEKEIRVYYFLQNSSALLNFG